MQIGQRKPRKVLTEPKEQTSIQRSINTILVGDVMTVDEKKMLHYMGTKSEYRHIEPYQIEVGQQCKALINAKDYSTKERKIVGRKFVNMGWCNAVDLNGEWFSYISHSPGYTFSINFNDVDTLWVKDSKSKKKSQAIRLKKPNDNNKFTVEYNGVIIFSGRDSYATNRFMKTEKYKRIINGEDYIFV
jgi:hypothetical protein